MSAAPQPAGRSAAGKIGVTLLCLYLLAVAWRIGGCYAPDAQPRDERPEAGPAVGAEFPPFTLADVSGARIGRDDLAGAPAVLVVAPSLDWSPPTKARLIDLAHAIRGRRDLRVAVIVPAAQATPRSLAFVRDRQTPFYYLVDDEGLVERLGLGVPAPDGTPAALPATFVLDARGAVRLRDVRQRPRTWLAPETILDAIARLR
jgi:peroxiredoxin